MKGGEACGFARMHRYHRESRTPGTGAPRLTLRRRAALTVIASAYWKPKYLVQSDQCTVSIVPDTRSKALLSRAIRRTRFCLKCVLDLLVIAGIAQSSASYQRPILICHRKNRSNFWHRRSGRAELHARRIRTAFYPLGLWQNILIVIHSISTTYKLFFKHSLITSINWIRCLRHLG